ncbi:hypothetical protein KAH81_08095, partial [bacterium]|nr:hypothetical protein [bacterium]
MSGNGIPDWGIGAAIPSRDEIILLLDEGAMSGKALELLAHELAHIFLHKKTGDVVIPRWFDEGFAQWCSGPMKFEQSSRLSRAFIFGNTIPLATLNEVNGWNRESAELAYAESRAAFDMLLERVPESTPIYLFERIKEAGDFEVGFRDAMGITV